MEVRLGEYDTFKDEGTEVKLRIEQIIIHPRYDIESFDSDIALLKLRQPVAYSDFIIPRKYKILLILLIEECFS